MVFIDLIARPRYNELMNTEVKGVGKEILTLAVLFLTTLFALLYTWLLLPRIENSWPSHVMVAAMVLGYFLVSYHVWETISRLRLKLSTSQRHAAP